MITRQDAIKDLSHTTYCCYCLETKGDRWSCCSENHFMEFTELYKEDQEILIEEYLSEGK